MGKNKINKGGNEIRINTTANTKILSGNITYSFPQGFLPHTVDFRPEIEFDVMPFEDLFEKKTADRAIVRPFVLSEEEILSSAKKYYEQNREILLRKYIGKYIAILNNKVIGSDRDFSKLAQRVYKRFGYQTIYMPLVEKKEKIVKIPAPRIKI